MNHRRSFKKMGLAAHWFLASRLPLEVRRHYLHAAGTGRWGDFETPKTFNEKLNWRILHDRRAVLVQACDKIGMKDLARAGSIEGLELHIPKSLWQGDDLATAPDVWNQSDWVLKPTNGSGKILLGPMPLYEVRRKTANWMASTQANWLGEWGYANVPPRLLLEQRIESDNTTPVDYKFWVFDGEVRLVGVHENRLEGRSLSTYFDQEWNLLPIRAWGFGSRYSEPPDRFRDMIRMASRIGAGWDFLRVDLYESKGEIWFGETTPYPGGGVKTWIPRSFDRDLGEWWELDKSVIHQ